MPVNPRGASSTNLVANADYPNRPSENTLNLDKVANETLARLKNRIWILSCANPYFTTEMQKHLLGRQDPRAGDELTFRYPREAHAFLDVYKLSGNWTQADVDKNPHLTVGSAKTALNEFVEHTAKIKLDKHAGSVLQWDGIDQTFYVNPNEWYRPVVDRIGNLVNSEYTQFLLDHATSLTCEHNTKIGLDHYAIQRAVSRMKTEGDLPGEWVCAMKPQDAAELSNNIIQVNQLPSAQVNRRVMDAYVGHIGGIDVMETHALPDHTTGKFAGTLKISETTTGSEKGDLEIDKIVNIKVVGVTATTAADVVFKKNDKFAIEGVYSVNRGYRGSTGNLQVFSIMEDVKVSDGSGTAGAGRIYTLKCKPNFLAGAKDPYRSVTNAPKANDKVYMDGLPETEYGQALLINKKVCAFVPVRMPAVHGGPDNAMASTPNGLKLHVMTIGDGLDYQTDVRWDMHWGQFVFTTGYNKVGVIRFKRNPSTANSTESNVHSSTTGGTIPTTGRTRFDSAVRTA